MSSSSTGLPTPEGPARSPGRRTSRKDSPARSPAGTWTSASCAVETEDTDGEVAQAGHGPGPCGRLPSLPASSRLTAVVAGLGAGDLATDRQPVVGDERGDHGHAEEGDQAAQQGSGGDP